jgi:hypothetical protein
MLGERRVMKRDETGNSDPAPPVKFAFVSKKTDKI